MGSAHADVLHHWTQLVGGHGQSFRAIVSDDACPTMTIDGAALPMQIRARPDTDFPNLVCEYVARSAAASAKLGTLSFPLRPAKPKKIVVVGDTGCRLKKGDPIQACTDPVAWPFSTVARSIAATQADLAIHAGDFHYREMKCPNPSVCGSVFGDNWPTWSADFFVPAQAMLSVHPFVFVRGDHEKCSRAWLGYIRYLAPDPIRTPFMCDNYRAAYVIDFEDLQLAVLDSSTRDRDFFTWDRLRAMRAQFVDILPRLDREAWLLTHAPLWGYGHTKADATDLGTLETVQREAFGDMTPRHMTAVISGDLHFAQVVSVKGSPTQITIGNGGVALYTTPVGHDNGVAVGKGEDGDVFGYNDFGFGLIDRGGDGVRLTLFDKNGHGVGGCLVAAGAGGCAAD